MMRRKGRFRIPHEREGESLLGFLCSRFAYHTPEDWRARIIDGTIRVNGTVAAADRVLQSGDAVEYEPVDVVEPHVDRRIEILHRDADLLIVNKSGNLPCHPGGRHFNHTLWAILKTEFGIAAPTFVNRLDRETSGLVLVALNPEAARSCGAQFMRRSVYKRYVALVEGVFPEACAARGHLRPDAIGGVRRAVRFEPGPPRAEGLPADSGSQWAETRFRRMAVHGAVSEVEAVPLTGRLHQIRATLRGLGYPIVGDKRYGIDPEIFVRFCAGALTDDDRRRMRMSRQALHAAGLRFVHPRTRHEVAFEAPLPADMGRAIDDARMRIAGPGATW